jgi:hypothetical protein
MQQFLLILGILAVWFVLNRCILPWFGIPTCMSGACSMNRCPSCDSDPKADTEITSLEPKGNQ